MPKKIYFPIIGLLFIFILLSSCRGVANAYDNYDFWIQTPNGWMQNTQGLSADLKKQVLSPDKNAFIEVYAAEGANPGLQAIADGMERGILNRGGVYFQNRIASRQVDVDGHPAIFREYKSTYNGSRLHAYALYTYANKGAVVAIGVFAEQFASQYQDLVYRSVTSLRFTSPPTMSGNDPYGSTNSPYVGTSPYHGTDSCSLIVGKWKWFTGSVAEFYPEGRMPGKGNSWRCADPQSRTFIVKWSNGKWIDTLKMSQDGSRVEGQNQVGNRVWGTRLSGPPSQGQSNHGQAVPKKNDARRIKGNMGAQWKLAHGSVKPGHPADNGEWELSTVSGTTLRFTDPYNRGQQRYRVKVMTKNGHRVDEKVIGMSENITVGPGIYKIEVSPEGGYAGWKCEWN